jgi:hypothetical protein
MRKCESCRGDVEVQVGEYTLPSLPGITLVGIRLLTCTLCSLEHIQLPNLLDLHKLIADILVEKGALTKREVQFLQGFDQRSVTEAEDGGSELKIRLYFTSNGWKPPA